MPQFQGVPLGQPLVVPAVGAEAREGQVHSFVELELLGDDFEGGDATLVTFSCMDTTDGFLCNVVENVVSRVR
ncbi:MAG: hypothetical protein V1656_02085 [Candidatus Jorgensenbacteria bacterium]